MLLKEKKKEERAIRCFRRENNYYNWSLKIFMKCIKILPSSFCLLIWFMEKYWIWVTNELLSFSAGSFMNEIFHAYFSLTVKIFYHFFITFPTVFKSLQLLSLFALKCREKKVFVWFSIYYAIGIPPIKQTCWQWLAEAQLFRHLWIRLWLPGSYQCISAGRKTFEMHQ